MIKLQKLRKVENGTIWHYRHVVNIVPSSHVSEEKKGWVIRSSHFTPKNLVTLLANEHIHFDNLTEAKEWIAAKRPWILKEWAAERAARITHMEEIRREREIRDAA